MRENNNSQQPYYDDEITLKELILKIIEFKNEILSKYALVIALIVLSTIIAYFLTTRNETTYSSNLSFILNEEGSANSNNAIAAILGVNTNIPLNKVTEIVKSARVLHNVILSKVIIDDKIDFIGNHIINKYNLHNDWNKSEITAINRHLDLTDFYFNRGEIPDFSTKELRALSIVHKLILEKNIKISYNDKTEIFNLTMNSINSQLTTELLNVTYRELITFYTYQTVGKPMENFKILAEREDSLFTVVKKLEGQIAYSKDRTVGIRNQSYKLSTKELERSFNSTSELYNKIRKNKEELEFILSNKSPEFQILDRTFIPAVVAKSKFKQILIGSFLGFFLSVVYIIFSKIIRDALNE